MNLLSTIAWAALPETADDLMYAAARTGVSANESIYYDIPLSMTSPPSTLTRAKEQAVYWLSLASRRADHAGNKVAQNSLFEAASKVEGDSILSVLNFAIETIQYSVLDEVDKDKVLGHLQVLRNGVIVRRIVLYGSIAVASATATWWLWRRRRP